MLQIGSKLGGYKVLHEIGHGGYSHVYLIYNDRAGRQWAAKEIPKKGGGEKGVIRRGLVTDAEILKKIHHPNIPRIIDVLETDDYWYIIMDYVAGVTLRTELETKGPRPQEDVVRWALTLCDVFHYLHHMDPKIIYRDTKPGNIILRPDGDISLIDFGTAREYKPENNYDTMPLGTHGYAAPEQYGDAGQTDERTDIYNLGATMYHLVTGKNPAKSYGIKPIRQIDASLSEGLEQIILKCTQQNPEDRYQSADELAYALLHYTEMDAASIRKRKIQKITSIVTAVLGVIFLIIGIGIMSTGNRVVSESYDALLSNASYATDITEKEEALSKAIAIQPERGDAYMSLLDIYLKDDILSKEESEYMMNLVHGGATGQKNIDAFAKSDKYAEFAYQLGLAYYYTYEGKGNRQFALPWLETAIESEKLPKQKEKRAEILARIASYYAGLGRRDAFGDERESYADYWKDLSELSQMDITAEDNAKTAIVAYMETVYQINMHANEFRKDGVLMAEMVSTLSSIKDHIENDINKEDRETYTEEITELLSAIEKANTAIQTAYTGQEEAKEVSK